MRPANNNSAITTISGHLIFASSNNAIMGKVRSLLVIDDDKDDFELIEEAAKVIDADISVDFLDRCENAHQYKDHSFDLVFLDINMPHHDGFSCLKGIRESGYTNLPVIMYTNSHRPRRSQSILYKTNWFQRTH